jgi:hypothetical protein
MSRLGEKSKFLEILAETPIVSFACKKMGIDRRTYYRWYKDDKDFRDQADKILIIGRARISDIAESKLIEAINSGNMRAIVFWLQFNEPRYKPVRTTYVDPLNHRHVLAPGEMCRSCGYLEPPIEEYVKNKDHNMTNEELSSELLKRVKSLDTRKASEVEIKKIIDDFVTKNNLKVRVEFVDASEEEKDSNVS